MHELETLLSRLKMEHLGYHVEGLLEQAAKNELNYREFLCLALQQEWNGRHQRGMEIRLKQARFPWIKTLEQFDFSFQPGIDHDFADVTRRDPRGQCNDQTDEQQCNERLNFCLNDQQ